MEKGKGVAIDGCTFMNNDPTVFDNTTSRGTAIYGSDCPLSLEAGGGVNYTDTCITHTGNRG